MSLYRYNESSGALCALYRPNYETLHRTMHVDYFSINGEHVGQLSRYASRRARCNAKPTLHWYAALLSLVVDAHEHY